MHTGYAAQHHRVTASVASPRAVATIVLLSAIALGCSGEERTLKQQLTETELYRPPVSSSTTEAGYFPTLYARMGADTQLAAIANPDPLESLDGVAEMTGRDIVDFLKSARTTMQERSPDSVMVPMDINLVLDRDMTADEVIGSVLLAANGSFGLPYLVMANGNVHLIEPPRMGRGAPAGWAAWVWLQPDNTFRWAVFPGARGRLRLSNIPSLDGTMNLEAFADSVAQVLDARDDIPPGIDRLIGLWTPDDLPYTDLVRLMDAIRFPEDPADVLAGRITLVLGRPWAAPPDSLLRD